MPELPAGWRLARIDELGTIERGRSRHRPRNDPTLYGGPYPFVQTGDIKAAGLRLSRYSQTYSEAGLAQSRLWPVGTLCITIAANICDTAILGIPACFPDSIVGFTPHEEMSDVVFVKYAIDFAKQRFTNISRGATQDNLSLEKLLSQRLPIPPLAQQRRIASILGAYDGLIDVNWKRIALLEEMARRVFEDAITCGSDKEGTDAATLVATTLGGDWGDEKATSEEPCETRVIRGTDFRCIEFGDFSTVPTRFISKRSLERRLLRPFDVVVENSINAKTRNAGTPLLISAGIIEAFGGSLVATSFCRLFRCTSPTSGLVLFHFMDWMQRNNEMRRFQVVATNGIANFQSEHFMKRAIVPLAQDMIEPLGLRLAPFAATTYQQQIFNLRRQRDLLLPRLISGEVSVSVAERELEAVA